MGFVSVRIYVSTYIEECIVNYHVGVAVSY